MALEYVPLQSSINPSFWHKLTELKLDVDKLEETNRSIWGYFSNLASQNTTSLLEVDSTSFNTTYSNQKIYLPFQGIILNKNTIELFKECNKNDIINSIGNDLWKDIKNDKVLTEPSKLNTFFILSFADLKKYHYYYWFGFPVPNNLNITLNSSTNISSVFSKNELSILLNHYQTLDSHNKTFFILKKCGDSLEVSTLSTSIKLITEENYKDFYFAFSDTSFSSNYPGNNLRNFIVLIMFYCNFLCSKNINIISFRLTREGSQLTLCESLILNLKLPNKSIENIIQEGDNIWVGWERNERGKLGPRFSNMKSTLDPKELAETSVDLNLKLMKWRLLPNIDLDKIKNTRCLLLGSGTLGCSVARILLGWGVRTITFVDNSTVSYSNPVRQSLFTFENSVKSSPKSEAAAENLKLIFPGVNSKGVQLSIPMPGHPVGESLLEKTKENVSNLSQLVQEHDVIFLLMDSRESRWLPTLLGCYYNKIVLNAALGFDTYLVMRHGGVTQTVSTQPENTIEPKGVKIIQGENLGCYFCNDITAPGNSLKDRTLDQQCTVTRPGVSAIAGALTVELAVSILQHPKGNCAPAFYKTTQDTNVVGDTDNFDECLLGIVPHSIRGFLSTYSQVLPATQKYKQCIACSDIILNHYKERSFEFLLDVFNSSKYLEELTGLDKIYKEAENADIWEGSDEEEWC